MTSTNADGMLWPRPRRTSHLLHPASKKGSSGKPHSIITYGINIAITTANPDENILDRRLKRAAVDFAEIIAANQLAAVQ